jgi:hypothetical protein
MSYDPGDVAVAARSEAEVSFDRSSRGADRGPGRGPASAACPAALGPGKQTLTSRIDPAIVQQRAAPAAPEANVHAAAAHGVAGSATTLPHLAPIQQAFGRHGVDHIRAHVGGAAAEGAAAMGANAFAVGDHVAFAGAPDLHTAAHEAAHVVQQRGGVQLEGGVGEVGDRHEQHADAVADLVVQGRSAEALLDEHGGQHAGPAAGGASGSAVQRHAFINGTQVKKTDSFVSGGMVDFVTDNAVRDYLTVDEFKNHVAGTTDYLGNMQDDINTWVRFSSTGLNVLGEAHDTPWSLTHVLAAVHSKNFISEAIASEDPTAGSQLKTAYDAHNADRYKDLGIENEKDKSKFGAEPLPPKIGYGMVKLLPYLNLGKGTADSDKNVHKLKKGATPDDYPGQIYLSLLQMGWAYAKDARIAVAMMYMGGVAVPPKLDALAQVADSVHGTLDRYITGLPAHGWLGDTLADPASAKLVPPLVKLVEALIDMLTEQAIGDPNSGLDAKQRKKFAGKTTSDEKEQMFVHWRDAGLQHAVKDAAARHVRYAGMGSHHLKPLNKAGLPANTQVFDMSGDDLLAFDKHTRELADIAVKQR